MNDEIKAPKIFELRNDTSILPSPYWSSAQQVFEEWLNANSQIIVGCGEEASVWYLSTNRSYRPTHKALLICVEKIIKEPCKHKNWAVGNSGQFYCNDCNAKLKPTAFEEVE